MVAKSIVLLSIREVLKTGKHLRHPVPTNGFFWAYFPTIIFLAMESYLKNVTKKFSESYWCKRFDKQDKVNYAVSEREDRVTDVTTITG